MNLLITAFGPFPGVPKNPSEALARRIATDRRLQRHGIAVDVRVLATEYAPLAGTIQAMVAETRPDAVLMLGVASRRKHLSVEQRAANHVSILHPDAAGMRPESLVLEKSAAPRRHARAPLVRITIAASRAGFQTRLSRTAGTYLCNASYYAMLGALGAQTPCLFLHIPQVRGHAARRRLQDAGLAAALLLARRPMP